MDLTEKFGRTTVGKTKWRVLGFLGVVWLVFTFVYSINYIVPTATTTRNYEITKFVFLSISAFGVLFSTLLGSFNAIEATQHVVDKIRFDRTENSFKYMQQWDQGYFLQARDLFRQIERERHVLSNAEIEERYATNPELEKAVITYFNFVEEIYLSIIAGRIDEGMLKEAFRDLFNTNYDAFIVPFKRFSNESTYSHVKALKERWK